MSDHYLVYCLRKLNGAPGENHKIIETRSMKNFDETAFLTDVSQINWDRTVADLLTLMCLLMTGPIFFP